MASIAKSPNGHRRILFYDVDRKRKTVHLGECSERAATKIKTRIESLLVSKMLGNKIEQDDASWLSGEGAIIRPKLEKVGLVEPNTATVNKSKITLSKFLADFVERNGVSKKPATRVVWGQVISVLIKHMPKGIGLHEVTAGHAKSFHEKLKASKLASSTIHKRISFARQFFQDAVDWELIDKNPFAKIKTQSTSLKSNVEVPMYQIEKVMAKCDTTWKAIIGLSRIGGLRCPSETLSITWGDIDWELGRMNIPEPKVEHHEGRGVRSCPLFPELRVILEALFNEATKPGPIYPPADSFVIDKPGYRSAALREGGWANSNLRTHLLRLLRRAGVTPWKRLFHSMRASRQTELERQHPLHVVCAWLGNTEAVAKKNYLLVTEEDFNRALVAPNRGTNPTRADDSVRQKRRRTERAPSTHENEKTLGITGKSYVFREIPRVSGWRRGELNHRVSSNEKQGNSRFPNLRGTKTTRAALNELVASWETLSNATRCQIIELFRADVTNARLRAGETVHKA